MVSFGGEIAHSCSFARTRFHSMAEAASVLGGPTGLDAILGFDEFARALRSAAIAAPQTNSSRKSRRAAWFPSATSSGLAVCPWTL